MPRRESRPMSQVQPASCAVEIVYEAIGEELSRRGVKAVFSLAASETMRIIVAATQRGIANYSTRHEQAAVGYKAEIAGSGVVRYHVRGPLKSSTSGDFNPADLVRMLEHGLPVGELIDLQASLAVPVERLAPMLGISKATFHRRKGAGEKLGTAE